MTKLLVKYNITPQTLVLLFLLVIYTDLFLISVGLFALSPPYHTLDSTTLIRLLVILLFTCFLLFKQLPAIKDRHLRLYRIGLPLASVSFITLLANMDWTLSKIYPHAFNVPLTKLDSVYFTVTTMATVGYGDIHPLSELVRLWLTVQIIIGAAFIGFIIQREVISGRSKKKKR